MQLFDPMQQSLLKLTINLGDDQWAVGAGFFVQYDAKIYLVTAFHNVSGGISAAEHFTHKKAPKLTAIDVYCNREFLFSFVPYKNNQSIFFVHPNAAKIGNCDVAIIDIATKTSSTINTQTLHNITNQPTHFLRKTEQNDSTHQLVNDMFLTAGSNVLVYGYPGGRDHNGYPIAVGSKIASYLPEEPYFLLSGYTSSGCSGGLVIAREANSYTAKTSGGTLVHRQAACPIIDQFLGVYTGRLEGIDTNVTSFTRTHIGVVWTEQIIWNIIEAQHYSTF